MCIASTQKRKLGNEEVYRWPNFVSSEPCCKPHYACNHRYNACAQMIDCIVNVGFGAWYAKGSRRLERSLIHHGFPGAIKCWTDELPPGSPTHQECPYGMKPHAIQWALDQGHKSILWLDSSAWCVKYPRVHEQAMGRDGYYLVGNGEWRADQWTNDACLQHFGITREQARDIPLVSGGIIGLDFRNEIAREFMARYKNAKEAGVFKGSWTAVSSEGSGDRYRGHRHDQSCASIIAHQLGLLLHPEETYDMYYKPDMPETVEFALAGM